MKTKKHLKTIGYMGLVAVPCALWINSSLTTKAVQRELRSSVEESLDRLTGDMERFELVVEEENGNRLINNLNKEITKDRKEEIFTSTTLSDFGVSSNINSFDVEGDSYFTYTFKKDLTTDMDQVQEYKLTVIHRSRSHKDISVQGEYIIYSVDTFEHILTSGEKADHDLKTIEKLNVTKNVNDHILFNSIKGENQEFTSELSQQFGMDKLPQLGYRSDLTYNIKSTKEVIGGFNEYDLNINLQNNNARRTSTKKLRSANVHVPREKTKYEQISDALKEIQNLDLDFTCINPSLHAWPVYGRRYTGTEMKNIWGFTNGIEKIEIPGINIEYITSGFTRQNTLDPLKQHIHFAFNIRFTEKSTTKILFDTTDHNLGITFYYVDGESKEIVDTFETLQKTQLISALTKEEIEVKKTTTGNVLTFATREAFEKFYHLRFDIQHEDIYITDIVVEHHDALSDLNTSYGSYSQITSFTINNSNEKITFKNNDVFSLPKIYSSDYEELSDEAKVEKFKTSFEQSAFSEKYNLSFENHIINTSRITTTLETNNVLSVETMRQILPDFAAMSKKDYSQLAMLSYLYDVDIYTTALNPIKANAQSVGLRHIFKVNNHTSYFDKTHSNNAAKNSAEIVSFANALINSFEHDGSPDQIVFESSNVGSDSQNVYIHEQSFTRYTYEEWINFLKDDLWMIIPNIDELNNAFKNKNFILEVKIDAAGDWYGGPNRNIVTVKINRGTGREYTFVIDVI